MAFLSELGANEQNALKIAYSTREPAMFFENRPTLGLLPKKSEGGLQYSHTMTVDDGLGESADFATAQGDAAVSTRIKFVLDWVERFSVARLTNTAIQLTKKVGMRATVNYYMTEAEKAISRLAEGIERGCWKTGYGEVGQIATGGISGATITLVNRADVRNFIKGRKYNFSASINANALRGTAGSQTLTVASVNRDNGSGVATVTFTANVSTLSGGGGSVTAGDYVFTTGDRPDSGTPALKSIVGIPGWIPITVTAGADFTGIDRSVDRDLYAGVYTKGTNKSALEAVSDHLARMKEYGKSPKLIACTYDFANKLNKELISKSDMSMPGSGKASGIIYQGFSFNGPSGTMNVVPVPHCPPNAFWALTPETWSILSANDDGRLIDSPLAGGTRLDVYNADSIELRNKFLGLVVCHDPSQNGVCQLA